MVNICTKFNVCSAVVELKDAERHDQIKKKPYNNSDISYVYTDSSESQATQHRNGLCNP